MRPPRPAALLAAAACALALLACAAASPIAAHLAARDAAAPRRSFDDLRLRAPHLVKRTPPGMIPNGWNVTYVCAEVGAFLGIIPNVTWGLSATTLVDPVLKAWYIQQGCDYLVFSCANMQTNYGAVPGKSMGTLPQANLTQWWIFLNCDTPANMRLVAINPNAPLDIQPLPYDTSATYFWAENRIMIMSGLGTLLYAAGMSVAGKRLKAAERAAAQRRAAAKGAAPAGPRRRHQLDLEAEEDGHWGTSRHTLRRAPYGGARTAAPGYPYFERSFRPGAGGGLYDPPQSPIAFLGSLTRAGRSALRNSWGYGDEEGLVAGAAPASGSVEMMPERRASRRMMEYAQHLEEELAEEDIEDEYTAYR